MQRYFIKNNQLNNNIITIDENDSHHIKNVMRMHIGEKVIATIEGETSFLCEIISLDKNVNLKVLEEIRDNNELKVKVSIAHGLVKRDKQEEVIRRLVELGAYAYIPVEMDRSVIKVSPKDKNTPFKNERYERIVKEASEQSERLSLLKLNNILSFKELINSFSEYDLVLFASVASKDDLSLKENLANIKNLNNILVIVGPEGGFSDKEIETINKTKAKTITLGKRVLRTETAPLAAMAIIAYEVER